MIKPMILVTAPVQTRSGYGNHSRDICQALIELDKYDVRIQAVRWGNTPPTALDTLAKVLEPKSPYNAASGASPTPKESITTRKQRFIKLYQKVYLPYLLIRGLCTNFHLIFHLYFQ